MMENSQEKNKNSSENQSENISDKSKENIENPISESISENSAENAENPVSESVPENSAENAENPISESVPENSAENTENPISESISENSAENAENPTSESISEDLEENIENPNEKRISLIDICLKKLKNFSDNVDKIDFTGLIVRAFASFFILTFYNLCNIEKKFTEVIYGLEIDIFWYAVMFVEIFIVLSTLKYIVPKITKTQINTDGYFLGTAVMLYAFTTVFKHNNFYYAFGISIAACLCIVFLIHNGYFKEFKTLSSLQTKTIVFIFAGMFIFFTASMTIYRYLTFSTSCFDFGLFAQMYYYMVNHGLSPETTCERNMLLSHFAVHTSPIYYLLVPIFAIFQRPETLLVCQALIVGSAVIPLYLICKNYKFSNASTMAICAMLTFSPALIMSTFFDFHENKFLVPLIMWIFWAVETKRLPFIYLFSFLTLLVKEDSFIYVVSIALFMVFSGRTYYSKKHNKEKTLFFHGLIIIVVSFLYFVIVSELMKRYGLGIMSYRYDNIMMNRENGLINVVQTILLNPALAIYESFNEEKIKFFLEMTAPLFFLPFISKKMSHIILLIPFFFVNLISDYTYQTQIGYQYVCGVMSMLIFVSVLNLHEMKTTPKRYISSVCMCTSMIMGLMYASDKLFYFDSYVANGHKYMIKNSVVKMIPQDASVEASTYLIPQLSQRDEVYLLESLESKLEPSDFLVLDMGGGKAEYADDKIKWALENGYEFYTGYTNFIEVYVQTEYLERHPEVRENQRSENMKMY